jgi:protein-S-isoprenylcysteine O-methyltransferase Ste14
MPWKAVIFLIGAGILAGFSRTSLRAGKGHGFHRFFAWETMLLLFLLNVSHWFEDPFAWYQLIAWTLLILSIVPVVWGTILLRQRGKPVERRESDPNLLAFEKTTALVTSGIYKYIRHPLYSSLLLLIWGIFFKLPSWAGIAMAVVATGFLSLTALADEAECIQFFGPEYQDYMKRTKRFIPFLF